MGQLRGGTARVVITPPRGIYLIGYGDRVKGNQGVHDDLLATVLYLEDETTRLAWVTLDILCLNESIVDQIQELVGPAVQVIISSSHTHSGPIGYADSSSPKKNQVYIRGLVKRIVNAIQSAQNEIAPIQLTWSAGRAQIAVNRRQKMPDGHIEIGINPQGPVDRSLQIVNILDLNGTRLATLVNFAAHGTVQGPKNLLVSADWIGAMRTTLEKKLGGHVLFLQGATANLNPTHGWEPGANSWMLMEKQGQQVAEQALTAIEEQEPISTGQLHLQKYVQWLPLDSKVYGSKPPTIYRKKVLAMGGLPVWLSFLTDFLLNQRYPWKSFLAAKDGYWSVPLRINTLTCGDLALASFSAETFTETGSAIKAASPYPFTIFTSITDGCIGYLPTRAAHAEGGFEVELSPYSYRYPAPFAAGTEEIALTAINQMLQYK
ncbi:MAG: hypothetical protein CVU39_13315 [Chloroflexi bacterium HGW-Chloroflexi-10]|nr:MAG: hypothetical protein CVU39_13315 [Chloroflexi bacterium HGW-Chloroflexi-10]